MKTLLLPFVLTTVLCACSNAAAPAPPLTPAPASGPVAQASLNTADSAVSPPAGEGSVRLHRSACFGRCPQYEISIAADGAVIFEGERFVAAQSQQRGQADETKLKALRNLLRQPESRQLKDIYRPGQPGCSRWATDMPSVELDWTLDGEPHHLNAYQGCQNPVPQIGWIAAAIDDAANSQQWIKGAALQ